MKLIPPLSLLLVIVPIALTVTDAKADNPQAKIALLTATMEGGEVKSHEFFTGKVEGDGDHPIFLQAEALESCTLLTFAWNDAEQKLHEGWSPVLQSLSPEERVTLPADPSTWLFSASTSPFSIYVGLLSPDDPALEQLETLVAAMSREGLSAQIRGLQANQLKRIYDSWLAGKDRSEIKDRHTRASAAVSYRGGIKTKPTVGAIEWEQKALDSNFEEGSPGLFIFSVNEKE